MNELLPFPPVPLELPFPETSGLPDAAARHEALDVRRSFVVEAPAGSGKTGLLIQRFLKLLADESVISPEQVLAITFTLKATAEMRDRVLGHLTAAARAASESPVEPAIISTLAAVAEPAPGDFDRETRTLALAVLERDRRLGWSLLDHPHRLNIRTIDAVCAEIARTLPVLSGSGGHLTPVEDAGPLHREAARRTLLLLGNTQPGADPALDAAIRDLLLHRDGNLADCEALIADMLRLRDQWGNLIPLTEPHLDDASLDTNVLPRLQHALDYVICSALTRLQRAFPADILAELTELVHEMASLDGYKGEPSPIAFCDGLDKSPDATAESLEYWRALIHLLTKPSKRREWRKSVSGNNVLFEIEKHHQTQLKNIIAQLSSNPDLLAILREIDGLPKARYPAAQWAVAKSLFRVLCRAMVELQLVFASRNQCDFTELGLLACQALGADGGPEDLASALGSRLQHLLVDEMQDTSASQYDLLELLTASWDGHSQTVFLVGDPRQSIYLFRQARFERFVQAARTQRLGDVPLTRLRLSANFRSQRALVDQFNDDFSLIFPPATIALPESRALPYTPAEATLPASATSRGRVWHANVLPYVPPRATRRTTAGLSGELPTAAQLRERQARRDAREILRITRRWIAKPLASGRTEPWRIAVLVRSRNHLIELISELRRHDHAIPFRAVEIEALNERQEVLDLTALTRALLHPADRVAALAVLRAPWCGLPLADMHTLTGGDDDSLRHRTIGRLVVERQHLLPEDSRQRVARVQSVLHAAVGQGARLTTAQLVERAWRSLGGDTWLKPSELTNARRFFQLLDTLEAESGSGRIDSTHLDERLQRLYAEPDPVPSGTAFLELLTIHKAKGLEWDVVMVPALDRQTAIDRSRLLTWSEIESAEAASDSAEAAAHVMLAPIAARGESVDPLTSWLKRVHYAREAGERKRLFYVACTRAREELHLFAAPGSRSNGSSSAYPTSLLNAALPAALPYLLPAPAAPNAGAPSMTVPSSWVGRNTPNSPIPDPHQRFIQDLAASADSSTMPLSFVGDASPFHTSDSGFRSEVEESASPETAHPILKRIPLAFDPAIRFTAARTQKLCYGEGEDSAAPNPALFARPEGSFVARAFGNAVHAGLEILTARVAGGQTVASLLADLPTFAPRIAAILRADGLPLATVNRLARETRAALENVLRDPHGLWMLAAHPDAASEFALTAWSGQDAAQPASVRPASVRPASVRIDRIFNAGPEPLAPGHNVLWIVDYKTATHAASGLDDFLASQRTAYSPQLETYARILAPARSKSLEEVRLALYFPTIARLIWWKPGLC